MMRYYRYIDRPRLLLGFLLAPALVPISSVVLLYALSQIHQVGSPIGSAGLALAILYIGTPLIYLGAAVFGLPYVCLMANRG